MFDKCANRKSVDHYSRLTDPAVIKETRGHGLALTAFDAKNGCLYICDNDEYSVYRDGIFVVKFD